jgi:hypothetical protein
MAPEAEAEADGCIEERVHDIADWVGGGLEVGVLEYRA